MGLMGPQIAAIVSETMRVTASSVREPDQPLLVRYRRVGPSGDQRLRVFEDGLVVLDERHRTRDSTWLTIDSMDLGRLRDALDDVPGWSIGPTLTLCRAGTALNRRLKSPFSEDLGTTFFQMRQGRRSMSGVADEKTDLAAVAFLDNLRAHAVQLAESLHPSR